MLVPVALDKEVLHSAQEIESDWQIRSSLQALAMLIARGGCLVVRDAAALDEIVAWIRGLPSNLQKHWEVLVTSGRSGIVVAPDPWAPSIEEANDLDALTSALLQDVRVAVLDDVRAELFGFGRDQFQRVIDRLEFVRFSAASASTLLQEATEPHTFAEGMRRDEFWDWAIEPAAAAVSTITVVDVWAGSALVGEMLKGERHRNGPSWFLGRLARRKRLTKVTLYTREGYPTSDPRASCTAEEMTAALERVGRRFSAGESLVVDLRVCRAGEGPHDRHLRFGDRLYAGIGKGLESFNGDRASEAFTYSRIGRHEAHDRERMARDAVRTQVEIRLP